MQGGGGNGGGSGSAGGAGAGGRGGFYQAVRGVLTGGGGLGGDVGGFGEGGGGGGASYTDPAAAGTSITADSTAENGFAVISAPTVNVNVAASPNPAIVGSNVTLTANVQSQLGGLQAQPTGAVDFLVPDPGDSASHLDLGTAPLSSSGTATLTVPVNEITNSGGSQFTIEADYNSNTSLFLSGHDTTTLKFNPDPVTVGHSYTVTANVASTTGQAPTGTVTFYSEGAEVSTIALNASDPVSPRSPHRRRLLRAR
jgi:hypothetical protein